MGYEEGVIEVRYQQVMSVNDSLAVGVRKIGAILTELDESLRPLMASWSGLAVAEYARKRATWNAAVQHMGVSLNAANNILEQMAHGYRSTDRNLALRWNGVL
jgi:WXG100 family type VII secretion target